jgi:hypothetical protein
MAEMDDLNALVANLPGAGLLTDRMKQDALAGALMPDPNGVWPGKPGYNQTYDIYYAASNMLPFLQAQPVIRQSSSEGTSVAVDAPSWGALHAYYRSMSPIAKATAGGILNVIPIPGAPVAQRVYMGSGGGYDDVDTDLA